VSDGQPVPPGGQLPLLARLSRRRKPDMTGTRTDGRTVDILATIGARREPPDPLGDDAAGWRADWWR
jgi:hypothetical protein